MTSFLKQVQFQLAGGNKRKIITGDDLEVAYDRVRYLLFFAGLIFCVLFGIQFADSTVALLKVFRCDDCQVNITEVQKIERCNVTCKTSYDKFLSPETFANHRKSVLVAIIIAYLSMSIVCFVGAYGAIMINYYAIALFSEALVVYLTSILITVIWNIRRGTIIQIRMFTFTDRPFVVSMPEVLCLVGVLVICSRLQENVKSLLITPAFADAADPTYEESVGGTTTRAVVFYETPDVSQYMEFIVMGQAGLSFVFFVVMLSETLYVAYQAGVYAGCPECKWEISTNNEMKLKCPEHCVTDYDAFFMSDNKNKSKRLLLVAFMLFWMSLGFLAGTIGTLVNVRYLVRWFYFFLLIFTFSIYSSIINFQTPIVVTNWYSHLFEVSIFEAMLYICLLVTSKLLLDKSEIDRWVGLWVKNLKD